jgi:hypothetical protein
MIFNVSPKNTKFKKHFDAKKFFLAGKRILRKHETDEFLTPLEISRISESSTHPKVRNLCMYAMYSIKYNFFDENLLNFQRNV